MCWPHFTFSLSDNHKHEKDKKKVGAGQKSYGRTTEEIKVTYFLSLEGTLLASLAVWTAASAEAASGVARRISHMSCWHSLFGMIIWKKFKKENEKRSSTKIKIIKATIFEDMKSTICNLDYQMSNPNKLPVKLSRKRQCCNLR